MVSALNKDEIERKIKDRYELGEKRIVGIMLARYQIDVIKKIVDENYLYWNSNTGKAFDIFRLRVIHISKK